jgi:nicotinamidase-related amidase
MHDALLLCDMWDRHWCATAAASTDRIANAASDLVSRFRARGGTVIHAPSDTMRFYASNPARRYVVGLGPGNAPASVTHPAPAAPAGGPACPDTPQCTQPTGPPWPWSKQHPAITIAPEDAILDRDEELFAVLADRGIGHVNLAGVHTNLCIMDRSFGIKALVRTGISCSLVGDMTEAMPPQHTAVALQYVERHWCPVVQSASLIGGHAA